MRDVEKYPEWEECLPQMKEIVDTVLEQEFAWNSYLFEDKEALGLNKDTMEDVIKFFATPVYVKLGIEAPFEKVVDNPVKHILHYFDTSLIQTASQEIQQTAYVIGALVDDLTDDTDLEYTNTY